jgi:pimeloyl-ACP methyl ester carboxylesterase
MKQTLLCIHGWPMSSATFSSLADTLSDIHVVAPNLPGFGDTVDEGFDHSLNAYADYVSAIAEGIGGDIHLVGLSMGGKIAMQLAASQPTWLRSMILLAPSYPDATIVSPDAVAAQLAAYGNPDALKALVNGWANDTSPLVEWALQASADAYGCWLTAGRPADISNLVKNIAVPTLVLHGANDPLRTAAGLTERVVERIAGSELRVIDGASHCIHMDKPHETALVIRDWLGRQRG